MYFSDNESSGYCATETEISKDYDELQTEGFMKHTSNRFVMIVQIAICFVTYHICNQIQFFSS